MIDIITMVSFSSFDNYSTSSIFAVMEQHKEHQKQCIERFGSVSCLSKIWSAKPQSLVEALLPFGLAISSGLIAISKCASWETD